MFTCRCRRVHEAREEEEEEGEEEEEEEMEQEVGLLCLGAG